MGNRYMLGIKERGEGGVRGAEAASTESKEGGHPSITGSIGLKVPHIEVDDLPGDCWAAVQHGRCSYRYDVKYG